jgi:hypothetical protein
MLNRHFGHANSNKVVSLRQAANPLSAPECGQALGHGLVQSGSGNLDGVTDPVAILNGHATRTNGHIRQSMCTILRPAMRTILFRSAIVGDGNSEQKARTARQTGSCRVAGKSLRRVRRLV